MRRLLFCGLLLIFSCVLVAQNSPRSEEMQAIIDQLGLEKEGVLSDEELVDKLSELTIPLFLEGKYQAVEYISKTNYEHAEKYLGEKHQGTLSSLNFLAVSYKSLGRYSEAEPLFKRLLKDHEDVSGEAHIFTLGSRNNLAGIYQDQGHYSKAEKLYQNALHGLQEMGDKYIVNIPNIQNNLATLYQAQGYYSKAEPLLQDALDTQEKIFGKEHPETLISVDNLGTLYQEQGRYSEAERLHKHAVDGFEKALGKMHPHTLTSLANLAGVYQAQGRYSEAEPLLQRALRGFIKTLGEAHPYALRSLVALYGQQGRYSKAESLLQCTLSNREQTLGKTHPDTLANLSSLASIYRSQGRYDEAESLYQRTLRSREDLLDKFHPDTLHAHLNLAAVLMQMGKVQQSLHQLRAYQNGLFELAGRELREEADLRDKRQLLLRHSYFQDLAFSLALEHPGLKIRQFAATVLLRWHQVDTEEQLFLQRLVRHSGDPKIRDLATQLNTKRRDFSTLLNHQNIHPAALTQQKNALQTLEQQLAKISQPFKQQLAIRHIHADDIQGTLPHGTGLMILRLFNPFNVETGKMEKLHWLGAWLAADQDGAVDFRFYDLGAVDKSANLFMKARLSGDAVDYQTLYQHFFADLDQEFAQVKKLYIVPDGFLHLTDFNRWRLPNGDYWIQRQAVHRLSTARDLLRDVDSSSTGDLVALGDIDYGLMGSNQKETKHQSESSTESAELAQRNLVAQNADGFSALPASLREVDYFNHVFWDPKGSGKLRILKQTEAKESALKKLPRSPRILHLATHGFYLEDKLNLQRPMVLSGLALANANHGLQGKTDLDGEDGILYALEAVGLNLEGTELVTLSACDTGKGVVDYSEGVYGLVQAFKLAGAKNVLMALQKVNDNSAMRFMKAFYNNWLGNIKQHPAVALRQTKLAFINSSDPVERDPEFWSPYVLVETAQ